MFYRKVKTHNLHLGQIFINKSYKMTVICNVRYHWGTFLQRDYFTWLTYRCVVKY